MPRPADAEVPGSIVLVDSRRVVCGGLGQPVDGPWCGITVDSVAVWTPR